MIFSTTFFFGLAPLFGADVVLPGAFLVIFASFVLYLTYLYFSRRLVVDIFTNDSPAQSPKRLVPWSVGAAFVVFVCGAIFFPLLAVNAVSFVPKSWFPDFASVRPVPPTAANVSNETLEVAAPETPPTTAATQTTETTEAIAAPATTATPAKSDREKKLATQHPLARLLIRSRSTPWAFETLLLCFFVAVIAAPFAEEFLFRALFQGTLENYALQAVLPPPGTPRRPFADAEPSDAPTPAVAPLASVAVPLNDAPPTAVAPLASVAVPSNDAPPTADLPVDFSVDLSADFSADATVPDVPSATEFRWTDPTTPMERRAFYLRSAFAILVPAFVFGLIHAGAPETPEEARDPETLNRLFRTMLAAGIANVAALIFGFLVLRRSSGATTGDVGLGPEFTYKAGLVFASLRRFALDFYRGVVAFAFIAPIIFGANAALRSLFPNAIVDPFPIFLFALAEGVVYWRIRRYATVVGMHVALNATSFSLLCASL